MASPCGRSSSMLSECSVESVSPSAHVKRVLASGFARCRRLTAPLPPSKIACIRFYERRHVRACPHFAFIMNIFKNRGRKKDKGVCPRAHAFGRLGVDACRSRRASLPPDDAALLCSRVIRWLLNIGRYLPFFPSSILPREKAASSPLQEHSFPLDLEMRSPRDGGYI
ncbi:hypothetical protein HPB51_004389 [Rhipicephalus microplus]|uniref:Uncharacterized protein n=1 Tax=Rhipicephalus microplus TaxID=6941 RepID=A0A9J6ELY7_RHIMP|nr:hypothetical protein HPB51_004389 [Rhipicephalus microplus]